MSLVLSHARFPLLRNQVTELDSIERPAEWEGITPSHNKVLFASFVHGRANKLPADSNKDRDAHGRKGICVSQSGKVPCFS